MSFKSQFESKTYNILDIPRILEMENDEVFVNKKGLYPNELESLQKNDNWEERDLVLTKKLKAVSCGDWQFHLGMINKIHFESRDKFDSLLRQKYEITKSNEEVKNIEQITIQNALKQHFGIKFSINMDYYLQKKNKIETELNHKVSDFDLKDDDFARKRIEQELFYKQMCSIIGVMEDDDGRIVVSKDEDIIYEKSFILKDFRLLADICGRLHATAQRGNYFLVFFYVSS
jgi:hypothetical protein